MSDALAVSAEFITRQASWEVVVSSSSTGCRRAEKILLERALTFRQKAAEFFDL